MIGRGGVTPGMACSWDSPSGCEIVADGIKGTMRYAPLPLLPTRYTLGFAALSANLPGCQPNAGMIRGVRSVMG
jgi:hypothetical protein